MKWLFMDLQMYVMGAILLLDAIFILSGSSNAGMFVTVMWWPFCCSLALYLFGSWLTSEA